jgi:hypothetical protein
MKNAYPLFGIPNFKMEAEIINENYTAHFPIKIQNAKL